MRGRVHKHAFRLDLHGHTVAGVGHSSLTGRRWLARARSRVRRRRPQGVAAARRHARVMAGHDLLELLRKLGAQRCLEVGNLPAYSRRSENSSWDGYMQLQPHARALQGRQGSARPLATACRCAMLQGGDSITRCDATQHAVSRARHQGSAFRFQPRLGAHLLLEPLQRCELDAEHASRREQTCNAQGRLRRRTRAQ